MTPASVCRLRSAGHERTGDGGGAWIETAFCHSRQLDTVKDRDNPSSSSGQQLNNRSRGQCGTFPVNTSVILKVLSLDPVRRPVATAQ